MQPHRVHRVVHHLRQKPRHVRENIALLVAGGTTLVVAIGWFAASAATGVFSLAPSSTVASAGIPDIGKTVAQTSSNFSDLIGAAGAAFGATSTPAKVTVVDSTTSAPNDADASATVIHF